MDQGDGGGSSPATRHTLTVTPTGSGSSSPLGGRDISSRKSSTSGEDLHSQLHDFAVSSLTYRDFFPKMREEGGTFSSPTYEEFGTLVERANEWLVNHREFDILNVECVEILAVHNSKTVDPNKASYYETSKDYTEFVRGFRMWLIPSSASEQTRSRGQRGGYIQYFDVVPECTHAGIVTIEYTKLSGLVEALNDKLRHSPINGDILTVQTLTLRFHSNEAVDSNRTCFSLHGHKQKIRLYFLRVFYIDFGDTSSRSKLECLEEIGLADFVPQILRHNTNARQMIEPLSSTVTRAGDWFIRYQEDGHPGLRIVALQTVVLHVKDAKNIDTQLTFYMAGGDGERYQYELRFVRLIYARQTRLDQERLPAFPRVFMKLFCPSQSLGNPSGGPLSDPPSHSQAKRHVKFGNVPDMVGRIQEWISEERPPIIGIETHGYSTYFGDEIIITAESPYLFDQGHEDKFWIQSIRVYYEGEYVESSHELPSPGSRKERRGSSLHRKQSVERKAAGVKGQGQASWPPLAPGSILAMDATKTSPTKEQLAIGVKLGLPVDSSGRNQRRASVHDLPRDNDLPEDETYAGFMKAERAKQAHDKDCVIC